MDFPLDLRERRNMAHPVDGETLSASQMRGQDLYRQKEYEAALQCFTDVGASWSLSRSRLTLSHQSINRDAHAPASVLDNRAATYTKLGNLRAALKDARQMIQQEKGNCSVPRNPPPPLSTLLTHLLRAIYVLVKFYSLWVTIR